MSEQLCLTLAGLCFLNCKQNFKINKYNGAVEKVTSVHCCFVVWSKSYLYLKNYKSVFPLTRISGNSLVLYLLESDKHVTLWKRVKKLKMVKDPQVGRKGKRRLRLVLLFLFVKCLVSLIQDCVSSIFSSHRSFHILKNQTICQLFS